MRKIIAGLLTILTVLSLCGCGSTVAPPQSGRATTSKQTTESVTQASDTQAPTSEQPTETEAQTPSVPESLFLKYFELNSKYMTNDTIVCPETIRLRGGRTKVRIRKQSF